MRRARSLVVALVAAAGLAACGSSSPTASPLNTALGYFPANSPFVMSVVTDPHAATVKAAQALVSRIPLATFGQAAAISRLQQLGINYDTDIRPLFGNQLLLGVTGSNLSGASTAGRFLAAWVTKSAGTLSTLIKKLHLARSGSHDGATLYQVSALTLAVDGATLVAGGSAATVSAALDRHSSGGGMSMADYDRDLGDLPTHALMDAVGNLSGLLSSPSAAKARSVPWVAALRGYGVAISASQHGLTLQYNLDTSGSQLTSAELPIAPGSSPPGLAGNLPIQFGLRQPAAIIRFALDAERRSSPARYAADIARMNRVLARRGGISFQRDLLGQIGSSAAVESSGHGYVVRVDVVNPAAAARTLRRLGPAALSVFGSKAKVTA